MSTTAGRAVIASNGSIYVADSGIHGRGVFAHRPFQPDEVIEDCPVIACAAGEEELLAETALHGLYFAWEGGGVAVAMGYGCFYNHSWQPNARYEDDHERGVVRFVAIRPIAPDDEITINYTGDPEGVDELWFDPR